MVGEKSLSKESRVENKVGCVQIMMDDRTQGDF